MYEAALVLNVVCLGFVTVYFSRLPSFSVFHPLFVYLLFHGFIFVFRPIVAYLGEFRAIYEIYQFTPSPSDKLTALVGSNIGMLSFAFFSLRTGSAEMTFRQDSFAVAERNRLVPSALWAIAFTAPIGLYSLLWLFNQSSLDASEMVMDKGTGTFINTSANGYLIESSLMLATVCVLIGWLFRFRIIALLPLLVFVVGRAGTGGRGPFVTAVICLGLLWLYEHRRKLPSMRTVWGGIAVILLFTAIGQDRGRSIRQWFGTDYTLDQSSTRELKFLEGMDFGNLEYFEFLVYAVPQRTGSYEYFADNLMLFTEPVPRVLWPGKPVGSPVKFFELFDYGFPVGMTRSLPGEGWTQLGWLGVVIWCGLWGLAFGKLYDRFVTTGQSTFWVMSYMTFIAMLVVVYRDGTVMTVMRQGLFYFMPILLWKVFATGLAVPRAVDLRAAYQRRQRKAALEAAKQGLPATEAESSPAAAPPLPIAATSTERATAEIRLGHLPPAVRRRREKLQAQRQMARS